ncbi:MAG: GNAT family N-acetyltransferase [Candidatus Binatia bacterium]
MRIADREEFPHLADVLTRAFGADPFHRWLFPDQEARPRRQRMLFERVLAIYDRHGVVYTTTDGSGVALWDPPRDGGPSLTELLSFVVKVLPVFGVRALRIAQGMAPLTSMHPAEPHWYLSVLGTDPARQRGGVGAALLSPVLERCDEENTSAYLESSRLENVPYYERFGFEVVAPVAMPAGGPVVYRMKREPRGQ